MPKSKILLIFGIASIVIILGSLALKIFAPSLLTQLSLQSSQEGEIVRSDGTIVLPVSLDSPQVFAASLNYVFEGKIVDITSSSEIITDFKLKGMPKLFLNPNVDIFFLDPPQFKSKEATRADLKVGQRVRIVTLYGLRIKRWTISRINILVPSLPESSTSASPN